MSKLKVYLFQPQYSIVYNDKQNYWLPYSVGCLWSYVNQFPEIQENVELAELFFRREPISDVISRMDNPTVCGFSTYVWNEKWNLNAAQAIKEQWPDCIIQFGGPQAHENYFEKYPFVDCVMSGEGEISYKDFLTSIINQEPYEKFYTRERIYDLDIPSPYLTGVFDQIIKDHPEALWNMTWETNRGCPYQCTFCDWGGVTYSKVKQFPMARLSAELDWLAERPIEYMFMADANFGIFKKRDMEIAHMLKEVSERSRLESINIQFAKNSTDTVYAIGSILGDLSRGITMSVQSMNDKTLEAIKRKNLPSNNVRHLMDLSEQTDVKTYTEVILGLPLETLDSWKEGLANILEMGQHNSLDVWFAQVLVNSELGQAETIEKYGIVTTTAKDYFPQYDPEDFREIVEECQIISQTKTMSREEIATGYMYAWLYMQFHNAGYSQIQAKYCRTMYDVSYFDYYETLFELVLQEEWLQDHFNFLHEAVMYYLTHGDIMDMEIIKNGGHTIHSMSYPVFYLNKERVFDLVDRATERVIGRCPEDVKQLQRGFIFDQNVLEDRVLDLSFDPINWQPTPSTVKLSTKMDQEFLKKLSTKVHKASYTDRISFDLYAIRRKGWLRNKIDLLKIVVPDKQEHIPLIPVTELI